MTINTADDYDSPWKDAIEHAFPEFMAFYLPAVHAEIDWVQGHEFKNTKLRQVVRDTELGKRFADTLVTSSIPGPNASLMQRPSKRSLPNTNLQSLRRCPMLTILTTLEPDGHITLSPTLYHPEPVTVLVTFLEEDTAIQAEESPATTLASLRSPASPSLPKRHITSIERLAFERGMQQDSPAFQEAFKKGFNEGFQQGRLEGALTIVSRQLTKRFGPLSDTTRQRLNTATFDQLNNWAERILDAKTLQSIFDQH